MFGKMMDEKLGKIHFWGTVIPFNMIFLPLFLTGIAGDHRRIFNHNMFPELNTPLLQHLRIVATVALLFGLLRYTRLGIRIRAGTLDLETVAALGINVGMLRSLNFAVGIFLAGLSGVLAAGQLGLEPTMGTGLLMPSFIAIIVGGVGSLAGTLFGGLLIGVASGVTAMFFPSASEAVMYVLMAVVLLIRPRGLLGEEGMMT